MLPRWLTALPRFLATWREELLVVAVGFAYQAGMAGMVGARHDARHEPEQVVVRIAAEAPRPMVVSTERTVTTARVATRTSGRCCHRHAQAAPVTAHVSVPMTARVAPVAPVAPVPAVAPVRVPLRVPVRVVVPEAGENVAAEIAAGIEMDSMAMHEVRASLEQARAAIDEARVRAALQKALAAERALSRGFPGPGV